MKKVIVFTLLILCSWNISWTQTKYGPYKLFTSCSFQQDSNDSLGNDNLIFHNAKIIDDPVRGKVSQISKADSGWFEYATPPIATDTFSLSLWYYWDSENNNAQWQSIFIFTKSGVINNHFYLTPNGGWNPSRLLLVGSRTDSAAAWEFMNMLPTALPTNQWYHFAITVNGSTVKTYVNGTMTASATMTTTPMKVHAQKFYFGCDPNYNRTGHSARYDDIKIFHQVLQDNQILALFKGQPLPDPINFSDLPFSINVNDDDYIFHSPDPLSITVTVNNNSQAVQNVKLKTKITTDDSIPVQTDSLDLSLQPGKNIYNFIDSVKKPGFYRYSVYLDKNGFTSTPAKFNVGLDPEKIDSSVDSIAGFKKFWDDTRKELAGIDPNYSVTKVDSLSTGGRNIYIVEMNSLGNERVKGYFAVPKTSGKYPVQMYFMGYGVAAFAPSKDDNGFAEFIVSARGQGLNVTPGTNYWEGKYGDYLTYGLDSKENYFYRGAYMDLIRAVDFVCTRPEIDTSLIFAQGTSQGGAYTFAVSALDRRIKACIPSVPFLSDFRDYFKIVSWPASNFKTYMAAHPEKSWEELYQLLSYFDIKNLAGWINCPLLMSGGVQDETCPGHINFAAYNQVKSEKSYIEYPLVGHWAPDEFISYGWTWIKDKLAKIPPRVFTSSSKNITSRSASLGGGIYSYGFTQVVDMGICYAASKIPTADSSKISVTKVGGAFTINVFNLIPDRIYIFRSYAITAHDTIYGDTLSFHTSSETGLDITETNNNFLIYPNPVSDSFTVTTDGNNLSNIYVSNILGARQDIVYRQYGNSYKFDTRHLSKGMYIISFITGNMPITRKFIKD